MIKHPSSRHGFTLVELLMVMAIISLLTSLAVLGFRGLTGSTGLTAAGDQVGALLAFGRQEAIAKDTMTAAVLITSTKAPTAAYRTFSIWEYVASPDGTTAPTWIQASKWQTMPSGTMVDNVSGANSSFLTSASLPSTFPTSINYLGTSLTPATDCAVQIFLPSGRLVPPTTNASNPYIMQLVEGYYSGSPLTPTYQHLNKSTSLPANYVQYIFSTATGEPKIVRP